ncbi:rep protein (plasmid) [Mycolicibacterium crocinum]|uniref:Rep protein n=1 Tax=Mycolicibacterium crocinum TaxID=388459 RepID=A0ABY5TT52_9MYCO|nr:rep protein [Mycolicibacterium crocinum]UVY96071.1 rep protein [Mycolicibacterium crocinum]
MSSACPTPLGAAIAPTPHALRALANERRRSWVERAGACAPRAPMWTSRAGWLDGLQRWAQSSALGQLCAAERVSITAATLLAIAAVMAEHADHATGRHVAVTRATIASRVGCDVRTVTAAWRVLRASQWAVEAQRGHGSPGTPSIGRRPSVYHLVPRRDVRPVPCPVVHDFHLPPSGGVGCFSPVGSYSPSGRASAPAQQMAQNGSKTRTARPPRRTSPRPLTVQRLAAELVSRTLGLDRAHIGTICDALTAASIDPSVWTARAITDALEADMRARGVTWPDHITNPGAFLHSRLRRLSWTPPQPATKAGGSAAASIDPTPTPVVLTAAAQARIAAAQHEIRRVLRDRAQHTATEHTHTHGSVRHRPRLRTLSTERTHPSHNDALEATTTPQCQHFSPVRQRLTEKPNRDS